MQAFPYKVQNPAYAAAMPIGIGRPAKHRRTDFGERLAQARESAGLTQLQLAEKLGATQRVITYWERGRVALRADQLNALADALGVTADFLLGREQPKARGIGPTGKMRQLFDAASALPRSQQQHIAKVVGALVAQAQAE
jgi:transcriptional regulator with XRE-family HTH domain